MVIFFLTIYIIFSGCVEESKDNRSNESVHKSIVNTTPENLSSTALSSGGEDIPEIMIMSFSSIYTHSNVENINGYLFSWDDVPGSENQRLLDYLMNSWGIGWVNNSHIIKTDDNKKIRIFTSEHSLEFTLDNETNSILTILDSEPYSDLKLKEENGKLCVYKFEDYKPGYNINENCYVIYNLSITNNGSSDLDFKLREIHLNDGDHVFNTTFSFKEVERIDGSLDSFFLEVISDLHKENEIENTTLVPGQTINGSVVFQVNSLDNKSFLLMYKETPIPSASFEKSIKALNTAERYNYVTAFGVPPYIDDEERSDWVNRSILEVFKNEVSKDVTNSSMEYVPRTKLVYASRVIPERNITIYAHFVNKNNLVISGSPFKVVDDTGEELINSSRAHKIGILNSGDSIDIDQMNFSNVTIVRISFFRELGLGHILSINQNVIVDKELKIVAASNNCLNFQGV